MLHCTPTLFRRRRAPLLHRVTLLAAAVSCALPAVAATTTWRSSFSTADWFTSVNWSAGVPLSTSDALIENGTQVQIVEGTAVAYNLLIGQSWTIGAGTGALTFTGGELNVGWLTGVGGNRNGVFIQSGGTHNVGHMLAVGSYDSVATYSLSDGCLAVNSTIVLGGTTTSRGNFYQSGGVSTAKLLTIHAGSTFSLTGGVLQVTEGVDNLGHFHLSGSTSLALGGLVDFGYATLGDLSDISIDIVRPNSLIVLPAGTTADSFKSFRNPDGFTVLAGQTITIPAGRVVDTGWGGCFEFIRCAGTITGKSSLYRGLLLEGPEAYATLQNLTANHELSGMTGGTLITYTTAVGARGPGVFTQSAGMHSTTTLTVGNMPDTSSTYFMQEGELRAAILRVGTTGTGNFIQTGGTVAYPNVGISTTLLVGENANAVGSYELSNGLLRVGNATVGSQGKGIFHQTGGTFLATALYLYGSTGSSGEYTLAGGIMNPSVFYIGSGGSSTFIQTAGTLSCETLRVGQLAQGSAYAALRAGTMLVGTPNYGRVQVGYSGPGTFAQSGGTLQVGYKAALYLGYNVGASGVYAFSEGLLTVAGGEYIGYSGTGTFVQTGGLNSTPALTIGPNSLYHFTGGTLTVTSGLYNRGSLVLGGTASLNVAGWIDFGQATLSDVQGVSVTAAPNTLIFLPPNTSTSTFKSFSNPQGVTAFTGSALHIPAHVNIVAESPVFNQPLICEGTLTGSMILQNAIHLHHPTSSAILDTWRSDHASTLSQGQLQVREAMVGYLSSGAFMQTGGTHVLSSSGLPPRLYLGYSASATGAYALSGGVLLNRGHEYVGQYGKGTFHQTGGTHTMAHAGAELHLGAASGSVGTYQLSGGELYTRYEYVGYNGRGAFIQDAGTHTTAYDLMIANRPGSAGCYYLNGGYLTSGPVTIGNYGSGSFIQTGGTHSFSSMRLSSNTGSTGYYSLSNGYLTGTSIYLGSTGAATFSQTNATVYLYGNLDVIPNASYTAMYAIGNNSSLRANYVNIGKSSGGTAILTLADSTVTFAGTLKIWNTAGTGFQFSSGTLYVGNIDVSGNPARFVWSAGNLLVTAGSLNIQSDGPLGANVTLSATRTLSLTHPSQQECIGYTGAGTLQHSAGLHSLAGNMVLANSPGSSGAYVLSGQGTLAATNVYVGGQSYLSGGTGKFDMSGGNAAITNTLKLWNATSRLTLAGGQLSTGALNLAGGTFAQTGGIFSCATLSQSGGAISLGGPQAAYSFSSVSLTAGTVTLPSEAAKVLLTNTLSLAGSGTLDLTTNALLVRNGSYAGLYAQLLAGRAAVPSGITSSAATPTADLALLSGADYLRFHPDARFQGVDVLPTDLLIAYTPTGDLNLDGVLSAEDYLLLDHAYVRGLAPSWVHGDCNYDNVLDYRDYALLDAAFAPAAPLLAQQFMAAHTARFGVAYTDALAVALGAPVPEPGSLALVTLPLLVLHSRRRR